MAVKPHAQTNNLEDVDDTKWPVTLVCTELAIIGMVNCDQGIDMGSARGFELLELQLTLIGREHAKVDAL